MKRIAVAALGAALICTAPGMAQSSETPATNRDTPGLPDYLVPVDQALPGGLMNDPTDMSWTHYGDALSSEFIVDESYPGGGAAMRMVMSDSGEIHDGGMNIPLLGKVDRGDRITIGFFARMIETSSDDGLAKVGVRFQQNVDPYPGFGEKVVDVAQGWGWYEVTAIADRNIRRDGIVALQFGLTEQTVEIGQVVVVSGTRTIAG